MGHFDQVGVPLRREAGIVDVARLKNTLWVATLGYPDHGTAQELGSRDVLRKQPSQEWQQRLCHGVEDAVAGRLTRAHIVRPFSVLSVLAPEM